VVIPDIPPEYEVLTVRMYFGNGSYEDRTIYTSNGPQFLKYEASFRHGFGARMHVQHVVILETGAEDYGVTLHVDPFGPLEAPESCG